MKKLTKFCLIILVLGLCIMALAFAGGGRPNPSHLSIYNYEYYDDTAYEASDEYIKMGSANLMSFHREYGRITSLDNLNIDISIGNVTILPGDELVIEAKNILEEYFSCDLYDEHLNIYSSVPNKTFLTNSDWYSPKITIYIPAGFEVNEAYINVSAGKCNISGLNAESINSSISLGKLMLEDIVSDNFSANVSGGALLIENLISDEADINVSAGEIKASGLVVEECIGSVSAGSSSIQGKITKSGYFDCSIGTLSLDLEGNKNDFDIDVAVSLGAVSIDGEKYAGNVNRHQENSNGIPISLNCGTGKILVNFK